ncbi:hypothetical protein M5689_000887 [Euphorbia peplus]|nr:hypothetical protein M5689_000887 [Euphorbia peplus]
MPMVDEVEMVQDQMRSEDATRGRAEEGHRKSKRDKSKAPNVSDALESRVVQLETLVSDARANIGELSDQVDGILKEHEDVSESARSMVETLRALLVSRISSLEAKIDGELHHIRTELEEVQRKVRQHRCTPSPNGASTSSVPIVAGQNVQRPSVFDGARNATIVENFIFGLEQFFKATAVCDDEAKIVTASTFLRDTAQLWWRRTCTNVERGDYALDTWEEFKTELRKHFVPHNASEEAKTKLRRLRQVGSISDYVKEFTTIMLEVDDISSKDALFFFKDGLKDWAKLEVNRANAKTLDDVIAIVENLVDISKHSRPDSSKSGGDNNNNFKRSFERRDDKRSDKHTEGKSKGVNVGQGMKSQDPIKPCFICGKGGHWTRNCPQKNKLSAMELKQAQDSDSSFDSGDEGLVHEMGTLQLLNALCEMEKPKDDGRHRGVPFVNLTFSGRPAKAMVDTGAMANFMDVAEAKRLRIKYQEGGDVQVKSKAKPIIGVAKDVHTIIGKWQGTLDFNIIEMEDYDVVLGLTFFDKAKAFIVPNMDILAMESGRRSYTVRLERKMRAKSLLNAMEIVEVPSAHEQPQEEGQDKSLPQCNNDVTDKEKGVVMPTYAQVVAKKEKRGKQPASCEPKNQPTKAHVEDVPSSPRSTSEGELPQHNAKLRRDWSNIFDEA